MSVSYSVCTKIQKKRDVWKTEKRYRADNKEIVRTKGRGYFEIDVYPFWNDKAIAEIELSDENAEIVFPKQIKVIKEVTDDDSFKNASLAKI